MTFQVWTSKGKGRNAMSPDHCRDQFKAASYSLVIYHIFIGY